MMAAVVFLVAVTVRLLHLFAFRDTALFDVLMGDARAYDAWAQRLAAGDWVGTEVFYQAPLYPYFLGAIYALAGRDLLIVRIVQALIGSASAVLLALAAERMASRRVGWAAGLGLALYAPAIFLDLLLQKSVLDLFFICLTLWLVAGLIAAPTRTGLWAGLGAALGALSLTRENALALVLVAFIWSLSKTAHEEHEGNHEEHEGRHGGPGTRAAQSAVERMRERTYERSSAGLRAPLRLLRALRVSALPLLAGLARCCSPSSRAITR